MFAFFRKPIITQEAMQDSQRWQYASIDFLKEFQGLMSIESTGIDIAKKNGVNLNELHPEQKLQFLSLDNIVILHICKFRG